MIIYQPVLEYLKLKLVRRKTFHYSKSWLAFTLDLKEVLFKEIPANETAAQKTKRQTDFNVKNQQAYAILLEACSRNEIAHNPEVGWSEQPLATMFKLIE